MGQLKQLCSVKIQALDRKSFEKYLVDLDTAHPQKEVSKHANQLIGSIEIVEFFIVALVSVIKDRTRWPLVWAALQTVLEASSTANPVGSLAYFLSVLVNFRMILSAILKFSPTSTVRFR